MCLHELKQVSTRQGVPNGICIPCGAKAYQDQQNQLRKEERNKKANSPKKQTPTGETKAILENLVHTAQFSEAMSMMYSGRVWQGTPDNPRSGAGSRQDFCEPYLQKLIPAIKSKNNSIKTILDLGTGEHTGGSFMPALLKALQWKSFFLRASSFRSKANRFVLGFEC